jgi:hypothetical protein
MTQLKRSARAGFDGENHRWTVDFQEDFAAEVRMFPEAVREKLKALATILSNAGPQLGRPYADTLNGSRHLNMKELRFDAGGGTWRVAYAFDPDRKSILLAGGDKQGISKTRFYRSLVARADERFDLHLQNLSLRSRTK